MGRAQVLPDLMLWSSVISCCEWQRALLYFADLRPDVIAFNGLLKGLTQWRMAAEALRGMARQTVRPDVTSQRLAKALANGSVAELTAMARTMDIDALESKLRAAWSVEEDPKDVSTLWWSCAMLGAYNGALSRKLAAARC